jgi:SAM-dependent methyltransferase
MMKPMIDPDAMQAAIGDPALAPLFTRRFVEAAERFDRLVDAAAWRILGRLGALPDADAIGPGEEAARLSLSPHTLGVLRFLYRKLADSGHLIEVYRGYVANGPSPGDFDLLASDFSAREPDAATGAEILALLVEEAGAFFRGEKSGEEILFSPIRLPLWFRYFSNQNLLYSINNAIGAEVLARALPATGAEVLEVGGGAGSAAEMALRRSGAQLARYRFTEVVPTFLRRGERAARAAASTGTAIEAFRLDMTKPWEPQGVAPASLDAIYSVNCFHVAPNLDTLLAEVLTALKPGGAVVVSECLKPGDPFRPIYVDFVFEFLTSFTNVTTHPVRRPAHGFLTPAAWRASFEAAGFTGVEVHPDVERLGTLFRNFFAGAVVARRPV